MGGSLLPFYKATLSNRMLLWKWPPLTYITNSVEVVGSGSLESSLVISFYHDGKIY